jgi:methionyl aminopeptidase
MTAVPPENGIANLDISGKDAPAKTNGANANNDVENDNSDDDEAEEGGEGAGEGAAKKKKKRKPRKKKKAGGGAAAQSSPPRTEVSKLFPNGSYPIGEEVDYLNENISF